MKKSLVIFLLCFCVVIGGFSGYWAYKNASNSVSLVKNKDYKTTLTPPLLPHKDGNAKDFDEKSYHQEDFWEKISQPSPQIAQDETSNPDVFVPKNPIEHPQNLPISHQNKVKEKPKMAIIMDDMAYPFQLQSLHRLKLKITPSFFPYNADNKLTPKMASGEPFYMVHLPLEALHFYQSPHRWIKVGESKSEIREYIKQIKHDFPRLKFINNHTGSKFTASYEDMKNLIEILREYDIDFVDSRTTAQTKAGEIYAQIKRPLLSRGIFLDNKDNVNDILHQIQKAINKAKKDGYVIAICHPHKNTFIALQMVKKLLSQVDLVYVKDIQKAVLDAK